MFYQITGEIIEMKHRVQQGNTIVTVLILLVGFAFVFSCYNPEKLPGSVRDVLPDRDQSDNGNVDPSEPPQPNNAYTVQVMTVTNREEAFAFKRALIRDGYSARVEEDEYGQNGLRYKIRIGRYSYKSEAVGVKDRIVQIYSDHFDDSFVYRY